MVLYAGRVSLPKETESENLVIDEKMREYEGKIIIVSSICDEDYEFASFHKYSSDKWLWSKQWLTDIVLLTKNSTKKCIMYIDDDFDSVIDSEHELEELIQSFEYVENKSLLPSGISSQAIKKVTMLQGDCSNYNIAS